MSKQRQISNEQILFILINLREKEAKDSEYANIEVNKEGSKELGLFTYSLKDDEEKKVNSLFLIKEIHNGEEVNLIYNEKGRLIAWQDKENIEKRNIQIAQDVKLEKEILLRQIDLGEEKANNDTSNGTSKAGEGRSLDEKEHEREEKNDDREEEKNKGKDELKKSNKLKDLSRDVNMDNRPKIRLDQIINGYYLWEILQIESRLQGRLPKGLNENAFRNGYLTIIDSKELEQKDGNKRQAEDTFVICTYSGDVIELDEQILQPQNLGSLEERRQSELTRQRYADGKETEKPRTDTELTRTSLYRIPEVNEKFGVAENWFLSVDKNRDRMTNGDIPADGVEKEISFVQVSRNDSIYASQERIKNSIEYKLDPIRENSPKNKKEIEKEEELKERKADEVLIERGEHTQEIVQRIVDKCFEKYKDLRRAL